MSGAVLSTPELQPADFPSAKDRFAGYLAALRPMRQARPAQRMSWSIRIFRVAGIAVRIHWTFLLFLGWIWYSYYRVEGTAGAVQGTLFTLALFACVLLHEFGHAFAARGYGVATPDITLLPIGGVARLQRIPDKPWQEIVVALAGPLVNVVIAGALILALHQSADLDQLGYIQSPRVQVLAKLASVNVMLVLFNLIPAFPMDGGRVLRALLAMAMPFAKATQVAAFVGKALGLVFVGVGFFGNPSLVWIGLFVFAGATQESAGPPARPLRPPPGQP